MWCTNSVTSIARVTISSGVDLALSASIAFNSRRVCYLGGWSLSLEVPRKNKLLTANLLDELLDTTLVQVHRM
jgi:hypothetical protein